MVVSKLTNLILRSLTLGSKFFLLLFLAKYLTPVELGVYGLIVASIGYALLVIGFDFYTFSNREIIKTEMKYWSAKLRDQAVFYLIIYVLLFPFLGILFFLDVFLWRYLIFFVLLLLLEHIAQELNRLFIVMSEQFLASIILFIRNGIWCFAVVPFMAFLPQYRTVETVLFAWLAGVCAACLLAARKLRSLDRTSLATPINWKWIKRGVKISGPMLCATLAVRGLFTFDRYLVKWISGGEVLGAYVLFMNISNSFFTFLDAGVIVFMYPKLIELAHKNDIASFNKNMLILLYQSIAILSVMSVISVTCIKLLLYWIGKSIYLVHVNIFYQLIAANCLFSLSLVPQIGLYSYGKDYPIIVSHMTGLVLFFVLFFIFNNRFGSLTVPCVLICACLIIFLMKSVAFFKLHKQITLNS